MLRRVLFEFKAHFLAKLALLTGFSYLFWPLDIIPDRIPVFGHLDEATSILSGLLVARLLVHPGAPGHDLAVGQSSLAAARTSPLLFRWLTYRGWWLIHTPMPRRQSTARGMVVMGGAARSGTTMLRGTLGRHPMIASLPETTVFLRRITSPRHLGQRLGWSAAAIEQWQVRSRSHVEFIERFRRAVLAESGKPVWLEKTPANVFRFGFVRRRFPHAKLIHVIRDGRDAVCSLRGQPWAKLPRDLARDTPEAARRCGAMWAASVRAGLAHRGDPGYFELRYEDLVDDPETVLRRLINFLELPWDDALLATARAELPARAAVVGASAAGSSGAARVVNGLTDDWSDDVRQSFHRDLIVADGEVFRDSVSRWRGELSDADRAALRPVIGDLLIELGYERDTAWARSV